MYRNGYVRNKRRIEDMKKIFLILLIYLWSSSAISQDIYMEEHDGEIVYNPCGKYVKQRDSLTAYFEHRFSSIYKDLNQEELKEFLIKTEQENSDIVNVRVFKSPLHPSYAIISSYLFQNFLSGDVLVELYCVKELNGSAAIFIKEDRLEEFMGKPFLKLGIE